MDELEDANKHIDYANIKENKDVSGNALGDKERQGFGFEDEKAQEDTTKKQGKKFGDGGIVFGRPKGFTSRKAGKFGGTDFNEGLDALDGDGSSKKKDFKNAN